MTFVPTLAMSHVPGGFFAAPSLMSSTISWSEGPGAGRKSRAEFKVTA